MKIFRGFSWNHKLVVLNYRAMERYMSLPVATSGAGTHIEHCAERASDFEVTWWPKG